MTMNTHANKIVSYYQASERTKDGEVLFTLRIYTSSKLENTITVPKSKLHDNLDALRKEGYSVMRV
jgi:hypothetical protein